MKKILLLFVSIAMLTACSKDEDDNKESQDPILGKWYLTEVNNAQDFQVNDCNSQSYINFKSDGTAHSEFFSENNGNCESAPNDGNWTAGDNSKYTFDVPGFGPMTGRVEFNSSSRFTFYPDLFASANTNLVFEMK